MPAEVLRHTPASVFGLFALLPLAMLGLSLYGLASAFAPAPLTLTLMMAIFFTKYAVAVARAPHILRAARA